MRKEYCPTYGKVCDVCNIKNHFKGSRKCRSKQVNLIKEYSSDESDTSVTINTVMSDNKDIFCEMKVNKQLIKLQIDSSATVCILPKQYVNGLPIRPEPVLLEMWNKSTMNALVVK